MPSTGWIMETCSRKVLTGPLAGAQDWIHTIRRARVTQVMALQVRGLDGGGFVLFVIQGSPGHLNTTHGAKQSWWGQKLYMREPLSMDETRDGLLH
jgi:hypothetical protein